MAGLKGFLLITGFTFPARRPLAGSLILLGMLLVSVNLLGLAVPIGLAGVAYWLAAALLWPGLSSRNRLQAGLLLLVGMCCLGLSMWLGGQLEWSRLLSSNVSILSMLVAVSFLSLVSRPNNEQDKPLPRGRRALAATIVAIHAFGAVINISSVFIIGDRLAQRVRLTREQSIVLVRCFSAAAFWSPFFAAMAVAFSVAPNAQLSQLWLVSMPLAALSLILTYWQLARQQPITSALTDPVSTDSVPATTTALVSVGHPYPKAAVADFVGYPLHLGALWLPLLLALAVLLLHQLLPSLSILAVITLLAPLFSLSVLAVTARSPLMGVKQLVQGRLPQMGNELVLFLAAGILAYGLESVLLSAHWQLPFSHFGPMAASVTYLCIVLLALVGIHPIVCITLAASLWSPLNPDHSLLALVFLSSWALGTATGPLSGINLAFQGRYGVDSFALMRWNLGYLALMSLGVIAGIYLLAGVLGL